MYALTHSHASCDRIYGLQESYSRCFTCIGLVTSIFPSPFHIFSSSRPSDPSIPFMTMFRKAAIKKNGDYIVVVRVVLTYFPQPLCPPQLKNMRNSSPNFSVINDIVYVVFVFPNDGAIYDDYKYERHLTRSRIWPSNDGRRRLPSFYSPGVDDSFEWNAPPPPPLHSINSLRSWSLLELWSRDVAKPNSWGG